jgi:spore photoproduct lyase
MNGTKLEQLDREVELYQLKFKDLYGLNKREELIRLLYEIARREEKTMDEVYQEVGEASSFRDIKKLLMQRRFPGLREEEYEHVLLTRVARSCEDAAAGKTQDEYVPEEIFVEKGAEAYPLTKKILSRFPDITPYLIDSIKDLRMPLDQWIASFGKKTLLLSVEEFDLIKPCPCTEKAVSCGYMILNLGQGCPYDCSYCYLQFYQNTPAKIVYVNPERFLEELDRVLADPARKFKRIGTGEYTDSLALDHLTEYSRSLVPYFKDKDVFFELKTKSDHIENLLDLDHGGRTVIGWSVSPEGFEKEETAAPSVAKRLIAARRVQEKGYLVSIHFDPIFHQKGWQDEYRKLVDKVYDSLKRPPQWISLGCFRFHRDLKKRAEFRHRETDIFLGEQIRDKQDEKIRYPKRVRVDIYRKMLGWIRSRDLKVPVYLCMEPAEVWTEVFGKMPYKGRMDEWIGGDNRP